MDSDTSTDQSTGPNYLIYGLGLLFFCAFIGLCVYLYKRSTKNTTPAPIVNQTDTPTPYVDTPTPYVDTPTPYVYTPTPYVDTPTPLYIPTVTPLNPKGNIKLPVAKQNPPPKQNAPAKIYVPAKGLVNISKLV